MATPLTQKQWWLSHFLLLLLLVLGLFEFNQIIGQKNVLHFLDVGQGDSILIQTNEFKNILIDTGPDGKVVEELSKKLNFFNQRIDLFILTHPDLDHYGGILDIMQKYPIKAVMLTGIASDSQLYMAFLKELRVREIPMVYPHHQSDLKIGMDLYLDFLYPFKNLSLLGKEVTNKNDTSISLHLRNGQGESLALLTGDAEEAEEKDLLLSGQDLKSPIFKLGHHGSKTSSTPSMLDAVQGETFIVSAGKDNKFGHPHAEVIERLKDKKIHRTAEEGAVSFVLK